MPRGYFASETYAGAHPAVLAALAAANFGAEDPYGEDELTAALAARLGELFGPAAAVLPVFTGTAANLVALGAALAPHEAVLCARSAHLNEDECGAIERLLGRKLLLVPDQQGKLTPAALRGALGRRGETRAVQPRVVSITQSTELGTTYSVAELTELCAFAHEQELLVHVDGARLANAAAFLGTDLAGASRAAGVDLLSLGFTKLGGLAADAVLIFAPELVQEPRFLQKQLMQVASKTRFLSAQLLALLDGELWRRNAEHANAMARRLAAGIEGLGGVSVVRPVEANSVFAALAPAARRRLARDFHFYVWDESRDEVRWTCSWDTEAEAVDRLVEAIRRECG
jgi:threonine aldolase